MLWVWGHPGLYSQILSQKKGNTMLLNHIKALYFTNIPLIAIKIQLLQHVFILIIRTVSEKNFFHQRTYMDTYVYATIHKIHTIPIHWKKAFIAKYKVNEGLLILKVRILKKKNQWITVPSPKENVDRFIKNIVIERFSWREHYSHNKGRKRGRRTGRK